MDISRDRALRRFDKVLQKHLHDIDLKQKIFTKNHSFKHRLIEKDLRQMVNSGRKLASGDLDAWYLKRTTAANKIRRTVDPIYFEQVLSAMANKTHKETRVTIADDLILPKLIIPDGVSNVSTSTSRDTSVDFPSLSTHRRSLRSNLKTSPENQSSFVSSNNLPFIQNKYNNSPKPFPSKWSCISNIIANKHSKQPINSEEEVSPTTEKPGTSEKNQSKRPTSDDVQSETQQEQKALDAPCAKPRSKWKFLSKVIEYKTPDVSPEKNPLSLNTANESNSLSREMHSNESHPVQEKCTLETSKQGKAPSFTSSSRWSFLSKAIQNNSTDDASQKEEKVVEGNDVTTDIQSRQASDSNKSQEDRRQSTADIKTVASRWRRLSDVSFAGLGRRGSIRRRSIFTKDQVVRSFIENLKTVRRSSGEDEKKHEEEEKKHDLSYLNECRYLRHYTGDD